MWELREGGTIVHGKTRSCPKKVLSNYNTPEKRLCYEGLLRNSNDTVGVLSGHNALLHGRTQTYKRESDRCPKCGQTYSVSYLPVHMRQCYEPSTPRRRSPAESAVQHRTQDAASRLLPDGPC